jgi:class 3 adenylate cyclase
MTPEPNTGLDRFQPVESWRPRTGLVTLLFTDMVGSTALKQQLGDQDGVVLFRKHHQLAGPNVKDTIILAS